MALRTRQAAVGGRIVGEGGVAESDELRARRFAPQASDAEGELLELVHRARRKHESGLTANNRELGQAIALCSRLLLPWLKRQVAERFCGDAKPEIDDLLAEAALRTVRARPLLEAPQQLLKLHKSILSALLADDVRRCSVRRREGNITLSLQRDEAAGAAAAQVVDASLRVDIAAVDLELKQKLTRLVARLPQQQRHIVRLWMQGMSLRDQGRIFGRPIHREWRNALQRLRQQLNTATDH